MSAVDNPEIPLLVLRPEAIEQSPHRGTQIRETFGELVTYFGRPLVSPHKDIHGGISLGSCREGIRRLTHFEYTRALGIDYDAGEIPAREISEAIGPRRHLTYPTHGSVRVYHKSRSILFLNRDVDGPTFKRCMRVVQALFIRAGITLDKSAVDATRWWFCPVVRPEMVADYTVFATPEDAPEFDVDELLRHADLFDAEHEAELAEYRCRHPAPTPADVDARDRRVRGAIRSAVDRLANATEGERHGTLNHESYSLARLDLREEDIAHALLPAWDHVTQGKRHAEGLRTVRDAVRARGAT
jgi:hypothetical protein